MTEHELQWNIDNKNWDAIKDTQTLADIYKKNMSINFTDEFITEFLITDKARSLKIFWDDMFQKIFNINAVYKKETIEKCFEFFDKFKDGRIIKNDLNGEYNYISYAEHIFQSYAIEKYPNETIKKIEFNIFKFIGKIDMSVLSPENIKYIKNSINNAVKVINEYKSYTISNEILDLLTPENLKILLNKLFNRAYSLRSSLSIKDNIKYFRLFINDYADDGVYKHLALQKMLGRIGEIKEISDEDIDDLLKLLNDYPEIAVEVDILKTRFIKNISRNQIPLIEKYIKIPNYVKASISDIELEDIGHSDFTDTPVSRIIAESRKFFREEDILEYPEYFNPDIYKNNSIRTLCISKENFSKLNKFWGTRYRYNLKSETFRAIVYDYANTLNIDDIIYLINKTKPSNSEAFNAFNYSGFAQNKSESLKTIHLFVRSIK